MRGLFFAAVFLLVATVAHAQTPPPIIVGPNSQLAWDMNGIDAATAGACTYSVQLDALPGKVLSPVTCATSVVPTPAGATCQTPLSQFPAGSHAMTMQATCGGVTSLPSAVFAYVDILVPVPAAIRLKAS